MMRYEESGDFTTTLHRRLLYILNENLPGSTWYCIAMKMLQYYGDLDMISIEEMASLCAVSKSTISKFIRGLSDIPKTGCDQFESKTARKLFRNGCYALY